MRKESKAEKLKKFLEQINRSKKFQRDKSTIEFEGFMDYSQSFSGYKINVCKVDDYCVIEFDNNDECVFTIEISKESAKKLVDQITEVML